jgi:hypothetical protein
LSGTHTYSGSLENNSQTRLNGVSMPNASVTNYGALWGNGAIGALTSFGQMAPAQNNVGCCNGAGVGILSIGDLALDYLVYFDINGAAAELDTTRSP